jgi:endonuclease/exonuclease/phosphatase (EEP) superfamily protein YafD
MFGKKAFLTGTIKLLTLFFTALSLISLLPATKIYIWPVEAISNFQAYYFFWHVFAAIVMLFMSSSLKKTYKILYVLQLIFISKTILLLLPYYYPAFEPSQDYSGKHLRVLYANVRTENTDYQGLKSLIDLYTPDVIALVEMNKTWSDKLGLKKDYFYHFEELREDNFGIALYSKFKLGPEPISDFGENTSPAIYTTIEFEENKKLHFVLLHAFPPASGEALYANRMLLRRISTKIRFLEEPTLVAGDFNATLFSDFFQQFSIWSRLKDGFLGRGLYRTWNAQYGLIRLTLDHILYKSLTIGSISVKGDIGSDHLPILADLFLNP